MKKSKKINKNKKTIYLVSAIMLIFFAAIIIYFSYRSAINEVINITLADGNLFKKECFTRRRLDGACTSRKNKNLWPVAIMIDNHPDAWPQYGLNSAQLVYNTLTEGGATRLMAVFTSPPAGGDDIEKIGPVRSARPYYLTWAKELDALYGHSGGSPEALEKIKEYDILNWEESSTYGPLYFNRDYNHYGPHNLFTSNKKIAQARKDWELDNKIPDYQAWQFNENATSTIDIVDNIFINYSVGVTFDIKYEYSTSTQKYLRFQADEAQMDGLDNSQIAVKNLIIQFVPEEVHLDSEDRLYIDTLGIGEAWIFYNNKMIKARWAKKEFMNRTYFSDPDGNEIVFQPGNVWIEVVPSGRQVEVE